jgi:hypothetical protein
MLHVSDFQNWQPLTAAGLALIVAVGTLTWNAHLARVAFERNRQQDRDIFARNRDHERRVLAASLLSEIQTLSDLFQELRHRDRCVAIRENLLAHAKMGEEWKASEEPIQYPPAIYEKCADRLGLLDVETAAAVVRYYNHLAGFRTGVRTATGAGSQSLQGRLNTIDFIISMLDTETPKLPVLIERLKGIVAAPPAEAIPPRSAWWARLLPRPPF